MLVTSTFNSLRWLLILVYPQIEKNKKLCTWTGNYSFEVWPITQASTHVSSNHVWILKSSGYRPSDMTKCVFNPLNFSELSKTHPRILLINKYHHYFSLCFFFFLFFFREKNTKMMCSVTRKIYLSFYFQFL
jgi:hypothetical protein